MRSKAIRHVAQSSEQLFEITDHQMEKANEKSKYSAFAQMELGVGNQAAVCEIMMKQKLRAK